MHISNYPLPPCLIVTTERVTTHSNQSLLKERATNSYLIEVSESFIPDDFIGTSLGGND